MDVLRVTGLLVRYHASEETPALREIDFCIHERERVALIGANGAGKSTLLLALCGVLPSAGGEIAVDGVTLSKKTLREIRRRVGMVFQNPDDQLFMPTVYDDVAFGLRNADMPEPEMEEALDRSLSGLGISHLKNRMSHKLSGGEKRMVALAGVLAMEPSLLLMDEPSSFLDPRARRKLMEALSRLTQPMLIATHDLDMALDLCDRAILLREGHVHADASVKEILCDKVLLEESGLELPLSMQRRDS